MLYVEIGLPHTEFIPKKKLVVPPRLLPDVSKMSARYAGFETVSKWEINALCDRLSKPKRTNVSSQRQIPCHSAHEQANKTNSSAARFTGKKKMSSKDIQSLVDRLSNTKSARVPDSQRIHSIEEKNLKSVVTSHAWNGNVKHNTQCSRENLEKYVHRIRSNF
ncbi:Hypothetical predicted protein [Mytilus galloprovincialis]|uniref:Uncharacterized protein n=1 Tax=Mytilus galloprovincialis TaxID=29158 RepID=A0A8B6C9Z8_MYTGA|nr:Hypothetical predicted protein [Mytilus galloprovincialis]